MIMDGTKNNPVLRIEMLSDFAVYYCGSTITVGKNAGAKFKSLLQMLVLAKDKGITREEIIDSLYDPDDMANVGNSLNNLIYQARGHIGRSKLPEGCEIIKSSGRYYWKSEVPTVTDVDLFFEALEKAESRKGTPEGEKALTEALAVYKGDLLPTTTENWAEQMRTDLRNRFLHAVNDMAELLREKKDTTALVKLYSEAYSVCNGDPDAELSSSLINALIDTGDTASALRQYDKAVRRFQSQGRGLIPEKLEACTARLGFDQQHSSAADLQAELLHIARMEASEDAPPDGAFYCNYPSFIDTVKLLRRNNPRDKRPSTLMLVTLVDYAGRPMKSETKRKRYSEELENAVRVALRVGDSFTRHDESGFLVLLPGADEENAAAIYDRITRVFRSSAGTNAGLRYRKLDLSSI